MELLLTDPSLWSIAASHCMKPPTGSCEPASHSIRGSQVDVARREQLALQRQQAALERLENAAFHQQQSLAVQVRPSFITSDCRSRLQPGEAPTRQ